MFYANNKNSIHWIIFLSCILAYWVSNTSIPVHISEAKSNTIAQIIQTWVTIHKDLLPTNVDKEVNKKITPTIWQTWNKIIGTQLSVWVVSKTIQKKNIEQSENSVKNAKKIEPVKSFENSKIILRDWWNDQRVQYAYNMSKWNMDFILTIEAESRWDVNAVWDGGSSFWLCQIHKRFNKELQLKYRALKTDEEKINLCYESYMWWVKRWVIKTRLYWYNHRKARAYLFTFK